MAKAEAKIPLRVEDKAARDAIKSFNRDFKASLGEINAAVALIGKGWRAVSGVVREVGQALEWGVKAALKAEGAASQFGKRLAEAKQASDELAVAIGKTVTQSETWHALVDVAKEFTKTMTDFFKSSDGQKWVEGFGRALATVLSAAAKVMRGLTATVSSPSSVWVALKNSVGLASEADLLQKFGNGGQLGPMDAALAGLERGLGSVASGEYNLPATTGRVAPSGKKSPWSPDVAMSKLGGMGDVGIEIEAEKRAAEDRLAAERELIAEETRLNITRLKQQENAALKTAEYNDRMRALEDKRLEDQAEFGMKLRDQIAEFAAGGITAAAVAFGEGENVLKALGTFVGGTVQTLGQLLIQLGTAGLAAGGLGTVIPILAPLTGGPAGIAASLAAIAVGAGMVAGGAALAKTSSGAGSTKAVSVSTSYGGGGSSSGYSSAYGIGGGEPGVATMRVTNVYLGQGVIVAPSPSEAGKQIRGYLRAAEARGY